MPAPVLTYLPASSGVVWLTNCRLGHFVARRTESDILRVCERPVCRRKNEGGQSQRDMSAIGPKRTFHDVAFDVAFRGKADMSLCAAHVRL